VTCFSGQYALKLAIVVCFSARTGKCQSTKNFDCWWLHAFYSHTVFGEVVDGMDVLTKMEEVGTHAGHPTAKVVIADCGEVAQES